MNDQLKYVLGLDLGIASIGWSVVEVDYSKSDDKYLPKRLIDCGVRTFSSAENPKTKESLNKVRREARGIRRNLRRRRQREKQLYSLFEKYQMISQGEDFSTSKADIDIWQIRGNDVFHRPLTARELARLILHIAKKRGYKSNRKSEIVGGDKESAKEGKKVLSAINENKKLLQEHEAKTYGQLVYKLYGGSTNLKELKKNSTGTYKFSFDREGILEELETVLNVQKDLGNKYVTDALISEVLNIVSYQRPFRSDEGIQNMVGKCELESDELRAPKASLSFLYFQFWQNAFNNLKLLDISKGSIASAEPLSVDDKEKLFNEIFNSKKDEITFSFIREKLGIPNNKIFYNFRYDYIYRAGNKEKEEKAVFLKLRDYQNMRKAICKYDENFWEEIKNNRNIYDAIAEILTYCRTDEEIERACIEKDLPNNYIDLIKTLPEFSKFGHLSLKALNNILPYLKDNDYYNSCKKAGYSMEKILEKKKYLPILNYDDIRNPVVFRSLTQTRKLVNAIIRKFGPPAFVHVELTREMAKNAKERTKIEKMIRENSDRNDKIRSKLLNEFGLQNPKGVDILKYKLWEDQSCKCAYSGEDIPVEKLFEDNYCQIDHAIPYSRSMNDSFNNKVLVLTRENQEKRNETPYQYFTRIDSSGDRWNRFKSLVESNKEYSDKKKENLLIENESPYEIEDFIERNLNDTKYISKFFKNYIEENLQFTEIEGSQKRRVYTFQGQVTANLRKIYDISKDRQENDRHHAVDATIVAVGTQSLLMSIVRYHQKKEEYGKDWNVYKEKNNIKFPEPWKNFKQDLSNRVFGNTFEEISNIDNFDELYGDIKGVIKPLFVSRMPRRGIKGAAHDATLLSPKHIEEGFVLKRVTLDKLDRKSVDMIYGDDIVKEVVRERLEAFNYDSKKAFVEPLFKPSKKGNPNQIKSVKLIDNSTAGVLLNKGSAFAKNSEQVRVDVFRKNNLYYFTPIYVHDLVKNDLPQKVINGKSEKDWINIDSSYVFQFSLYPDDLFSIECSNKKVYEYVYYISIHRTSCGINLRLHDKSYTERVGAKTALNITKYQVDMLGNISKVKAEKRYGFSEHDNIKTS